jgi:hypothetical protein
LEGFLERSFGCFARLFASFQKLGAVVESVALLKRVHQDSAGDGEFGLASIPLDFCGFCFFARP